MDALTYLRAEADRPVCECGEPECVYVANLATALEHLYRLTGLPVAPEPS